MDKIKVYTTSMISANWIKNKQFVQHPSEADLILLPGGADISPELYGEPNIACGYTSIDHDLREIELIDKLNHAKQLVFGICRGLQLINIYNGGNMIQDVTNHCGEDHSITLFDNSTHMVTSCHHQMCYPWKMPKENFEILGYSSEKRSKHYYGSNIETPEIEPELIYFNNTNMLGIQGHPEWMQSCKLIDLLNDLILKYINNETI